MASRLVGRVGTVATSLETRRGISRALTHRTNRALRSQVPQFVRELRLSTNTAPRIHSQVTSHLSTSKLTPVSFDTANSVSVYLSCRFPNAHAGVSLPLLEVRERMPMFAPRSVLDFGAGPGTVLMAWDDVWARAWEVSPKEASMGHRRHGTASASKNDPDNNNNNNNNDNTPEDNNNNDDREAERLARVAAGRRAAKLDKLRHAVLVESSPAMVAAGKTLLASHRASEGRTVEWVPSLAAVPPGSFDLVTCAYTLTHLDEAEADKVVRELWRRTKAMLVLVEYGTPVGFSRIRRAREQILAHSPPSSELGAFVVSPCPHDRACPMAAPDLSSTDPAAKKLPWCHFSQRLQASPTQRSVRESKSDTDLEKVSYVVIAKGRSPRTPGPAPVPPKPDGTPVSKAEYMAQTLREAVGQGWRPAADDILTRAATWRWDRVLSPPLQRPRHVIMDVCTSETARVERRTLSKGKTPKDNPMPWKDIRKAKWGDLVALYPKQEKPAGRFKFFKKKGVNSPE